MEVFNDVVREAAPQETALDAYRSLLFLQDELRRRRPAGATPAVGLVEAPPPPARADTAFVELAVGDDDRAATGLLESLGFSRAGEHRSKPVTWWRNGEAHVVLNRGEATTAASTAARWRSAWSPTR